MLNVLVTGANGFIGGQTVRRLAGDARLSMIPATRDGRDGTRLLDLTKPDGMPAALAGVDAVVHCAVGNRAVTVDGTRALLRAATQCGVRRFVHISSIAVYGMASGAVDEGTPMMQRGGNGYAAMKVAAEECCLAETLLPVVRLRPSIVYGPGGVMWVGTYARRVRAGRWGVLGEAGEGICNPVHVSDVTSAISAALTVPGAVGMAFNVNGPETITWNGWFTRLAALIQAPTLRTIGPVALAMRAYATLPVKALARVQPRLAPSWLQGGPSPSELKLFAHRAHYPTDTARGVMGWLPGVPIEAGLLDTLDWLRAEGLAP